MRKRRVPMTTIAKSTTEFEQMITSIRDRLRSNNNRLLADYLPAYVGLSCERAKNESRLLKMLLQELSAPSVLQDA
jgi:hypothetical protein